MSSQPRILEGLTLEEFLRTPGIDEPPYQEYIDGRVEVKVSPQKKHGIIQVDLCGYFNQFAKPRKLGRAFPELRCTFAGRSILPDVTFLLMEHIPLDERGEPIDETLIPPDIHVEIISPDKKLKKSREKLIHSTSHGCPLGWLIHPSARWIEVYRPGQAPERFSEDDVLEGEPVLEGFRLPVSAVFGWLKLT